MSNKIDKVVKVYKELAAIPALIGGRINYKGTIVNSTWSLRNLERLKLSKFGRNHLINDNLQEVATTAPFDVNGESLSSFSATEAFRAVIREVDEKDGHKQYLEIWSNYSLEQTIDLAALDLHGDVYIDGEFSAFQWSPDENKLLYVAEKKEPKSESFYKRKPAKKEDSKDSVEIVRGEQYVYKQDWGEQLVNKKQTVLVLYDRLNESFKIMEGIPEGLCPAQPTWAPDGTYIVGIAYRTHPRKLGLIYCTNRPGAIFTLDFDKNYDEISTEGKSVRAPQFTPDGKTLIWLQRDVSLPHYSCMALVKKELPLKPRKQTEPTIVVDTVDFEKIINGGLCFYGLYNSAFPKRCWASERRIVLSTNQKNTFNTYVVDIDSGDITELVYSDGSQIVLDVKKDMILVNRRNFLVPDKLAIGILPSKGKEGSIIFNELTEPQQIEYFHNSTVTYLNLKHNSEDSVDSFSAIYIGPKMGTNNEIPLIVWPHGGPHSAFANNFTLESSLLLAHGYAVLMVNYRGSTGAGDATINFLLGKVGDSDVKDCVFATQQALQQFPWLNSNRLALIGGSHGGFLITHLSGQHPDMFKVVIARNPVIDIASMSIMSDIPDWCYAECGSKYDQVGKPSDENFVAMRKASPIQHAHKVKAPTLLQVGSKDLRVPPSQAMEYYHRLKANGSVVKMNLYDDNHPLGSVTNEMDNVINTLLWIQQHI